MKGHWFVTMLVAAVAALLLAAPVVASAAAPAFLDRAAQALEGEFQRLDAGLQRAAQALGRAGLTGEKARAALAELCGGFDDAVDCAAVDPAGRMVTIEPAAYRPHEGADIGAQEQVRRLRETGKPVLSRVFTAVEGFPAVDAEYPVVTPEGRFLGSVSLLFRPERLLGRVVVPLVEGAAPEKGGRAIWAMEENGHILYDVDTAQVGLNLFTSPLYRPYPGLVELGRRIARLPAGEGAYAFLRESRGREAVTKRAFWQSVSLYGTSWRLVAVEIQTP